MFLLWNGYCALALNKGCSESNRTPSHIQKVKQGDSFCLFLLCMLQSTHLNYGCYEKACLGLYTILVDVSKYLESIKLNSWVLYHVFSRRLQKEVHDKLIAHDTAALVKILTISSGLVINCNSWDDFMWDEIVQDKSQHVQVTATNYPYGGV